MLIGDKGESGGRRWVGVRIWGIPIFGQSQGQSLGGGKFCLKGIFYQSSGQSQGVPRFASRAFLGSPKVHRWGGVRIPQFGISGQSSGQSLGRCPDLPSGHFRTVTRSPIGVS